MVSGENGHNGHNPNYFEACVFNPTVTARFVIRAACGETAWDTLRDYCKETRDFLRVDPDLVGQNGSRLRPLTAEEIERQEVVQPDSYPVVMYEYFESEVPVAAEEPWYRNKAVS